MKAKHTGMKAAAWILAGILGAGGGMYGMPKNVYADDWEEEDDWEDEEDEEAEETEKRKKQGPAEGTYMGNIQWTLDEENTLTVTGEGEIQDVDVSLYGDWDLTPWNDYAENIKKIVIGEGITYIGLFAFCDCINVEEISMADTVTAIGDSAFCGYKDHQHPDGQCKGVKLKLSQSLETIGESAFEALDVASVELPDSVISIGNRAFYNCYTLHSFTLGENSQLQSLGKDIFIGCPLDQGEIDLPDTIQDIWCDVFENGTFSEKVVFSPNLWMLGMRAFGSNCTGLEKVFFTGDAPEIFDYPDSWGDDKVFPDTTTAIYYPKDNASWDGFDFSRLANNAQFISYDVPEEIANAKDQISFLN